MWTNGIEKKHKAENSKKKSAQKEIDKWRGKTTRNEIISKRTKGVMKMKWNWCTNAIHKLIVNDELITKLRSKVNFWKNTNTNYNTNYIILLTLNNSDTLSSIDKVCKNLCNRWIHFNQIWY